MWKKCPGASLNHQRSFCVKKREREGEREGEGGGEEEKREEKRDRKGKEGKRKKKKGEEKEEKRKEKREMTLRGQACTRRRNRGGRVYRVLTLK